MKAVSPGTANGLQILIDHPGDLRWRHVQQTGPHSHLVDQLPEACAGSPASRVGRPGEGHATLEHMRIGFSAEAPQEGESRVAC